MPLINTLRATAFLYLSTLGLAKLALSQVDVLRHVDPLIGTVNGGL